jgi:hypothetical protein
MLGWKNFYFGRHDNSRHRGGKKSHSKTGTAAWQSEQPAVLAVSMAVI